MSGLKERLVARISYDKKHYPPVDPLWLEALAEIERLEGERDEAVKVLRAAQSFIADGGLAEMYPGSAVYVEITETLTRLNGGQGG